jgi:hypothetical protein
MPAFAGVLQGDQNTNAALCQDHRMIQIASIPVLVWSVVGVGVVVWGGLVSQWLGAGCGGFRDCFIRVLSCF